MIRRLFVGAFAWIFAAGILIWSAATIGTSPAVYAVGPDNASSSHSTHIQSPQAIAQASTATPTPQPTLAAPIGLISPTLTLTATATVTATPLPAASPEAEEDEDASAQPPVLSPTPTPRAAQPADDADDADDLEAVDEEEDDDLDEAAPLTGTIVTNRSNQSARFFIEGQTIELGGARATSFNLPRATTVLNLYNCAASTPESNADCYWDPYILQRDGFYEIYQSRPAGVNTVVRLMLRAADAPPTDQVWIQNRTGAVESIVYRNEVVELAPAAVEEFAVDPGLPAILYVRTCLELQGQIACEWSPTTLEAGIYYALTEERVAGGLADSHIISVALRPVVGDVLAGEAGASSTSDAPMLAAANEVLCHVQVPTLNIRNGPGLQYEIIGKIFSSESEPGDVLVVGRNADSQWLAVDPAVMTAGWVTASESFILCDGDISPLPLVEAPPLPAQPAPASPVVVQPEAPSTDTGAGDVNDQTANEPVGEGETGDDDEAADLEETDTEAVAAGYSLLVVHNGFQHEVRFTLDQQFRPELGGSEFDLQPGQSTSITVFPGSVAFSVSSPWSGLSGNALIEVERDSSRTLWLRFEPDGSDSWRLVWE